MSADRSPDPSDPGSAALRAEVADLQRRREILQAVLGRRTTGR